MMIKYIRIFLFIIALGLVSCTQVNKESQIKGHMSNTDFNGHKVKLFNISDSLYKVIDSTTVEEGHFKFDLNMENPAILTVRVEGIYGSPELFIGPNSKLELQYKGKLDKPEISFSNAPEERLYLHYKETIAHQNEAAMEQLQKDTTLTQGEIAEKSTKLFTQKISRDYDFIKKNPKSLAALYVFYQDNRMGALSYKKLNGWMHTIDTQHVKSYGIYQKLKEARDYERKLQLTGKKAPTFTLDQPNGKPFSLSSLHGKYVLIDFWASWCAPCRKANKHIKALYAKYSNEPFEIISISMDDDKQAWEKAIAQDGITWINVSDLQGFNDSELRDKYHVKAMPTTFLLDKEGVVIDQNLGESDLSKELQKLFN